MKITIITGNRPQFIKAAAFYRSAKNDKIDLSLIHTGQHYDENMSSIFFKEMDLPDPNHSLGIGGGSHGAMTGRMIESLEKLLLKERPDVVLVMGDTNSTLAGALAAVKMHIPVAHVEAGLRSYNRKMPEEINRVLTDHASDYLFTPCEAATKTLLKEGIANSKIYQTGDVMYDVFLHYRSKAQAQSTILKKLNLKPQHYVLATVHRAENTDLIHPLREIMRGLCAISKDIPVVFPLHPRTRKVLHENKLIDEFETKNLILIDPVGYFDMLLLEENAKAIFTDSGGVQKEAYFCRVPCLTLRHETEWTELIQHGFNRLVPPQSEKIIEAYAECHEKMLPWEINLYGKGDAAKNILDTLSKSFNFIC
jgi:UDP-GlcNAc3NAcA epimerase